MRNQLYILLALSLATPPVWGAPRKMKGDDLSNMIIEGENRLNVHGELPPLEWSPEVYRDLKDMMKDESTLSKLKPPSLSEPPMVLPTRSKTKMTANPWEEQFFTAPILTLETKPTKSEDRKVEWTLRIKDSQGKVFFEEREKGILPRVIEWNGLSNRRKPIHVGYDYSYSLFIIDEAGNPQRYAGKPFNLDTFQIAEGRRIKVHIDPESLFTDKSSLKFSKRGQGQLEELKDQLRLRYGSPVTITIYDNDLKFAEARAKAIRNYLVSALVYPIEKIEAESRKTSQGEGYRYVEIVAK